MKRKLLIKCVSFVFLIISTIFIINLIFFLMNKPFSQFLLSFIVNFYGSLIISLMYIFGVIGVLLE